MSRRRYEVDLIALTFGENFDYSQKWNEAEREVMMTESFRWLWVARLWRWIPAPHPIGDTVFIKSEIREMREIV